MTDIEKLSQAYQDARRAVYEMPLHEKCRLMWELHGRIEEEMKDLALGRNGVMANCRRFLDILKGMKWHLLEIASTLDKWFSPVVQSGMNTDEGESPESSSPE